MHPAVQFVFVLHDHQPVGNFDGVIEQAYHDAYLPMLELLERRPHFRVAIHTSGPLAEWLADRHPDYLDRLAALAARSQVEIVGGAFAEPVLAMLPARDRIGQIKTYTQWLERRFHTKVSGMWVAERVWDPGMTADIAAAGIEWTILDDSHFKAAGLSEDQLDRHWLTEGDGATLAVFPVSERLRYVIPFAAPHATIDHLRWLASRRHGALAIFGDDGEKFGVWPDTKKACFDEGWLETFFSLLEQNADWIEMSLPSEVVRDTPPAGTVWLPECSYREMTEWVLPPEKQLACVGARVAATTDPALSNIATFIRGGTWRNFRNRYPEANEMYARMLAVSARIERIRQAGAADPAALAEATQALYRGQCNCAYWHGAFGGIYLPHLRNAIFRELIAAEKAADRAEGRRGVWVEATTADYDFDGRTDVRLASESLDAWIAPAKGGMLYELDLRDQEHNLLATLDRRPEAYHEQVLAGPGVARSVVDASQLAKFKQQGLERMVRYDSSRRKSLVDHFWDVGVSGADVAEGTAIERGDFASGAYEASIRRNPGRIQVLLSRAGNAWGIPFSLSKAITLEAGARSLEIAYKLEGLPRDFRQHLAIEFNFAGLPAQAAGRFFYDESRRDLGELGSRLDLEGPRMLGLVDDWLDIDARLSFAPASNGAATGIWTFPIQSVSQSEGGFELVHQSVVVMPHWIVTPDADGTWKVTMRLDIGRFSKRSATPADRL
ncbi:MAG: alpha-amylase/4-alpha-glucanotransferase domain-containing protein, partial [Planctomycetia bacterium]